MKWQFKFIFSLMLILIIDQIIKSIFLNGFRFNGEWLSLILVFNKGVAFSMFAFLADYLKYIQFLLLIIIFIYFYKEKFLFNAPIVSGILFGAGLSNLLDRFFREGVVDYIYYHGFFNFAVFNFADVMIDFSILMLIYKMIKKRDIENNA